MYDDPSPPRNFAVMAAGFEGGLAVVAVGLGWLLGLDPLGSFRFDMAAVGLGVTAALPLLLLLWLCVKCPLPGFRRLLEVLDRHLLPLFRECRVLELAVIAALAGLGEEMLLRGIVQAGMAAWIGGPAGFWVALFGAAVLFGALHAVTPTYALLAGTVGLYLGWLWIFADYNLLAPVTAHAAYDFFALIYLLRARKPLAVA